MLLVLLGLACVLACVTFASGAGGGIALIQHTSRDAGTITATTLAFRARNTVGNWIAVCIRAGALNETFNVSDSNRNTYRNAIQFNQTINGFTFAIFYAENIAGGTDTIRVGDTASGTLRIAILEYSGVARSRSLDATATAQGSSAAPSSGYARTTLNGDLLLGAIMTADPEPFTAGTGYKIEEAVPAEPGTKLMVVDQEQRTAGAASAGATLRAADPWAAGVAAFKAAGGAGQPLMSVVPTSANFGDVAVGLTNTQTVTVKNSGSATLNVTQTAGPGTGFHSSGLVLPLTIAPGHSAPFTLSFTPTSSGSLASSFVLISNATNSPTVIAVSGTGVAPIQQLSTNATSLNFGNAGVGTSSTQRVDLTNTGNSNISLSRISVAGSGFSASGLTLPVTLPARQTVGFNIVFAPTMTGNVTGSASIISTAIDNPLLISLAGSGGRVSHLVDLNWRVSTSAAIGYYVYTGTQPSGPFVKLNSAPIPAATYTDNSVVSGQTYYYFVTAVNSSGVESAASSQISVAIP